MKKILIATTVCSVLLLAAVTVFAATHYFQGFEADTFDWSGVTRVSSGTNGITSAAGAFHAEAAFAAAPGTTDDFTRFGGYENVFPAGGYTTSVDVYLNVGANNPNDTRFDWSSAINTPAAPNPNYTFRRDFVFNAGFYNDTVLVEGPYSPVGSGPRFVISASNNATRSGANPRNLGMHPITISTSGWYTFIHKFSNNGGVLKVDLSITNLDGTQVTGANWTLSDLSDTIGATGTVGGHRYGWLVIQEFPVLAIDNVSLLSVSEAATVSACKNGGWQGLTRADGSIFANQGDCIQYVNTGK
jgi:hypothetical protein